MTSAKAQAIEAIEQLPNDCTMEDIQYRLYVIEKVERGLAAADRGDEVSHVQVKERLKQWLTK
jgi:predicted transcriptional regulator